MKIKKLLAFALVLTMCLSLFPVFAAADEGTPTITAYDAANVNKGTYSTIDAAATAAGENGKIVLSAGTFAFNGRQTIAVNGITLQGAGMDQTSFITSGSYAGGSTTNRKALLTIAASNVTVSGISFDGGNYGRMLVPQYNNAETEFSVVRVNSGSASFSNVSIAGSMRTLLTVGTSSSSATVTASNFYCEGLGKAIPNATNWNVFADVDVENGSFTMTSGAINAFLQKGSNGTVLISAPYHYNLQRSFLGYPIVNVTTTTKHLVDMYEYQLNDQPASYESNINEFRKVVRENIGAGSTIATMVSDVSAHSSDFSQTTISGLIALLEDAKSGAKPSQVNTLNGYITTLSGLLSA